MKPNLSIVGGTDQPLDFIGAVERAIKVDEAKGKHLDQKTRSAVARLEDIIVEAQMGYHPEAATQAADAVLLIPLLTEALRKARALIPLDAGAPEIQELDAAIRRGAGE